MDKLKLSVDFINPVLESTIKTLKTMAALEPEPGKAYVKKPEEISGDVSGMIAVKSAGFQGTISISFPEDVYAVVMSRVLGVELAVGDDSANDGVAELINIIFGQTRKVLEAKKLSFAMPIPVVTAKKGHSVQHHSPFPAIVIPFYIPEHGAFRVEVCVGGT